AISSLLLCFAGNAVDATDPTTNLRAYYISSAWLFLLGASAGFFNVPLEAYIQQRSDLKQRGTVLAASNFISFSLMLLASGLFYVMREQLHLSASTVFLIAGLGTIPIVIYVFGLLPQASIRCLVWFVSLLLYCIRVRGRENLPETGGALLVSNHIS